jgi:putative FmdB family regulatory protein
MPTYEYKCLECDEEFTVVRSILADKEVDCPACNKKCSNVLITGGAAILDKTPRTLGTLAEQNRKKFGSEYCQQKALDYKKRSRELKGTGRKLPESVEGVRAEKPTEDYIPKWRKGPVDKSLSKLTPEQTKRYVKDGIKPI